VLELAPPDLRAGLVRVVAASKAQAGRNVRRSSACNVPLLSAKNARFRTIATELSIPRYAFVASRSLSVIGEKETLARRRSPAPHASG